MPKLRPTEALRARVTTLDVALLGIMTALALWLRVWGNGLGLPSLLWTDEAVPMETALSGGLAAHRFDWPPGLGYMIKPALAVYWMAGHIGGRFGGWTDLQAEAAHDPTIAYLIGRSLCGVLGAITVLLVAVYGRRWYGAGAGYAAAALLAVNPAHVRQSHFIAPDVAMVFFVTLALGYAVAAWQDTDRRRVGVAAVLLGCAVGVKYNAILAVGVLAVIHWRHRRAAGWRALLGGDLWRSLALVMAVAAAICWSGFLRPAAMAHGMGSILIKPLAPFPGHARGLLSWLFGEGASMAADLGWLSLVAMPLAIGAACRRRKGSDIMLLAVAAPVLLASSISSVRNTHYVLPALPALCLLTAALLGRLAQRIGRWRLPSLIFAVAALAACPLRRTVLQDAEWTRPDTRNIAASWASGHLPAGSGVLMDRGCALPLDERVFDVFWVPLPRFRLRLKDQPPQGLSLSDHPAADYGVLGDWGWKRWSQPATQARYPRTSAAYRRLAAEIRARPRVARFAHVRGSTQGPVIDIHDLRRTAHR